MFTVIKDTREKVGSWDFSFAEDCTNQEVGTVKTGDYTLRGYEDILCIERKRTTGEVAINLGSKWKTFERELERMSTYVYRYIILEFAISDVLNFPVNSSIPRNQWDKLRMNGKFLLKKLNEIEEKYGIEIIYAGSKEEAEQKVLEIFRDVIKQN